MKARFKLFMLVVVVLGFAVSLAAFLNYNKFRKMLVDQERSRFSVTGLDVVESIQRGFDLGISLTQMNYMQDVLDRLRTEDPRIDSLYIFDEQGKVLYQSAQRSRSTIDPEWSRARDEENDGTWNAETELDFAVGFDLRNNFEKRVGGIAVEYSRAPTEARIAAVLRQQVMEAGLILVVAAAAAFGLVGMLLERMFRPLLRLGEADVAVGETNDLAVAYHDFRIAANETAHMVDVLDDVVTRSIAREA